MAIQLGDSFKLKSRQPLDSRIVVNDIASLTSISPFELYDGIIVFVKDQNKFYTYNSTNSDDIALLKWRELTTAGKLITSAEVEQNKTSSDYGHLLITLTDGTVIDCGNVMGAKGDTGDGFAISHIHSSVQDMIDHSNTVEDGHMIAVIQNNSSTGKLEALVYIKNSQQVAGGDNLDGFTFFCNLADAAVIQGPKGDQGDKGDKGDSPIITSSAIAATATTPDGIKVTITVGNSVTSFNIYNGKNGESVVSAGFNANNELVFTLSNGSEINVGKITSSASSNDSNVLFILGLFNSAPASFNKDDAYYNITDNKIHTAISNTSWDSGVEPEEGIIYLSLSDNKLYAYTHGQMENYGGGNIELSTKDRNALIVEQDGLYVEDLSQKVNQINIAQNTVNEALDHAEFKLAGNTSVSTVNQLIPFTALIDGNMKLNGSNHISLKANHSYQIICNLCYQDTSKSSFANIEYAFVDDSNNKIIQLFQPYGGDSKFEFSSTVAFQYTPTQDCGLYLKTVNVYNVDIIESGKTTLTIQEIGRAITIDPVNHIDTTQGIQDVPVGTLINTEGPQNPDHYLLCNGAEYNIADYRDLAEAIKKVYGKYNYFGGDGINTFAVPKYVDTNKWFSPKQTSNSNPYNVSASSAYNGWQVWWGFNNNCTTSASNAWHSAVGSTTGHWVQIDFKAIKPLRGISMAPRPEGNYNVSRMPRDFDIMGSNDGTTWNIIKSYTGIDDYENYKYREFIFDRPEKYRYYRIANIVITGDCVNIADIHFLEAPEKYVYIKCQPTYFIGNITGLEEIVELLDTPKEYRLEVNNEVIFNDKITLKQSITNFDYLEVITDTHHSSGSYTYPRVDRIYVKDIQYQPNDSTWGYDTVLSYEVMPLFTGNANANHTGSFGLAYNFRDANTLRVLSSRCARLDGGTAWETRRIKAIKGIKRTYNLK